MSSCIAAKQIFAFNPNGVVDEFVKIVKVITIIFALFCEKLKESQKIFKNFLAELISELLMPKTCTFTSSTSLN